MLAPPLQPILENAHIILCPITENDFEELYEVASDPLIWEQHPNKDRWKKEVFRFFFEGAIKSGGAFKILDKNTSQLIGSTRFYDFNEIDNSILIGYTFLSRKYWGKGINQMAKRMMLEYIFEFVIKVQFHIGADNLRSQIAIQRTGGKKIAEVEIEYYGEASKLNYVYVIHRVDWLTNHRFH